MKLQQAFDIIENDPDYEDVYKWKRKHLKAQYLYYLTQGFTKQEAKYLISDIRITLKMAKKEKGR